MGASVDDGGVGSAYVFEKGLGWIEGTVNQVAKLTACDRAPSDLVGHGASISGGIVIVGAFSDDSRPGMAYVFQRPPSGWPDMQETVKLTASDGAAIVLR